MQKRIDHPTSGPTPAQAAGTWFPAAVLSGHQEQTCECGQPRTSDHVCSKPVAR